MTDADPHPYLPQSEILEAVEQVRKHLAQDRTRKALQVAQSKGFPTIDALLDRVKVIVQTPRPTHPRFLYPKHSRAEVRSHCHNRDLMIITLPNGKTASCWRGRSRNPVGARIFVKLLSLEGDPIYETTLEEPGVGSAAAAPEVI